MKGALSIEAHLRVVSGLQKCVPGKTFFIKRIRRRNPASQVGLLSKYSF